LESLLASGDLDALVTVQAPREFPGEGTAIRRLFPNFRDVEREYYLRTRIFPIMHFVVVRRDVYERNRWIAAALVEGFQAAKQLGTRRMRSLTGLSVSLPWLGSELADIDDLFGGDAFPYGVELNRHVLDAMCAYSFEQGLSERLVAVDELFAAETYDTPLPL
jgi:4,5-dihydroxyphthalate decarboxylase